MSDINQKQVEAVFSDKQFVQSLLEMESPEAVQTALKEKGIDFTLEDIAKVRDTIIKNNGKSSDELNLEELEDVAGGILVTTVIVGVAGAVSATATGAGFIHRLTDGRW